MKRRCVAKIVISRTPPARNGRQDHDRAESIERLDGLGGYTCFGRIDEVEKAHGLLPIRLTENVLLTRPVQKNAPVPLEAVELDDSSLLMRLRREQMQSPSVSARRA